MSGALFFDFAQCAENVGATTKRLEKAAILGEYFSALDEADLVHAARYFSGYIFPLNDQRVINIGGAALMKAIQAVTQANEDDLRRSLVETGDAGEAAFHFWPQRGASNLTLTNVSNALEELAQIKGSKAKLALVEALFQKASAALEGKYLVKLLSSDLRIGLKEGAVEDTIARLYESNIAQVQWANMLLGDIGETALLARHKNLQNAQMRLFHPLKFMLATPAEDLTDVTRQMPEQFAVEDKFDGIRAQAHIALHNGDESLHGQTISGSRVALFSRALNEITGAFPDLLNDLARLASSAKSEGSLILDGEILPVSSDKILPFQELQKRLGRKNLSEEILQSVPVAFIAYDCLFYNGEILLEQTFSIRRAHLEKLPFKGAARLAPSQLFEGIEELDEEFDAARARGNEGLMVKDPRSFYKPGRRGREWLKIKRAIATLDVVVTAVEVGNGRRSKVLSDYTFAVLGPNGELLNVGKAYSGLTDKEIADLSEWFRAHTLQEFAHGKVRVVEPKVVIEVTFDRIQVSPRHKSGYALRFPRILRVRDDKPVEEIDTLETVKAMAESL